ncbi:Maff2 family mobile element protein [Ruminococcus callidus]|uniref:Maff2 family mobile element protein n=1 Tax=Ruminococcus callidus TaxID=40519 RepID=UPI003521C638
MAFFSSAIDTLQTLVIALGAGLGVWGVVNLLEGYGSDNPGSKSQGMKQLMAGLALILLGIVMIPVLVGMMNITTG